MKNTKPVEKWIKIPNNILAKFLGVKKITYRNDYNILSLKSSDSKESFRFHNTAQQIIEKLAQDETFNISIEQHEIYTQFQFYIKKDNGLTTLYKTIRKAKISNFYNEYDLIVSDLSQNFEPRMEIIFQEAIKFLWHKTWFVNIGNKTLNKTLNLNNLIIQNFIKLDLKTGE